MKSPGEASFLWEWKIVNLYCLFHIFQSPQKGKEPTGLVQWARQERKMVGKTRLP